MPQPEDSTQDYRSKISYPQLGGNVSGTVSNAGVTVAPTPPQQPTAPMAGSIPSSFKAPLLNSAGGGSGSGGGGGTYDSGKPELKVNIQRPMDLSTGQPATQPPPGSNVVNPYAVTQPPAPDTSNTDWGKRGTRNEGVFPDKRSDAGNMMVADNSAPRRFIAGQEQSAADAAATWGDGKSIGQPVPITAPQGLTRDERNARTQKTNQGPTDPAMRKQMGLPPLALNGGGSGSGGGGGSFDRDFNTQLAPQDEQAFATWKAQHAPNDSGADYDLRGAYKAGVTPDPATGHWPDTFKKPNHPTFSDQSQYAQYGNPGKWNGDTFVPAITQPAGVRAAQAVKSAVGSTVDAVGAVNRVAGAPVRMAGDAIGKVASAAGTFGSDFGKELLNLGGSQITPPGAPVTAPAAATPAPGAPAPIVQPPVTQPAATPVTDAGSVGITAPKTAKPAVPALLGGNGVADTQPSANSGFTRPALLTPPTLQANGPVPTLKAGQNENVFEAITNLSKEMSAYKGTAAGNMLAQKQFENQLKAAGLDEKYAASASRERTAELQRMSTTKDVAARITSAEKIAKLSAEALKKQVSVVQIGEEHDPSDPTGMTKRKVFGMSMLDADGKPIVTDLAGKPISSASQQKRIEAPPAAISDLKKNPGKKAEFLEKYGYLPAGM